MYVQDLKKLLIILLFPLSFNVTDIIKLIIDYPNCENDRNKKANSMSSCKAASDQPAGIMKSHNNCSCHLICQIHKNLSWLEGQQNEAM